MVCLESQIRFSPPAKLPVKQLPKEKPVAALGLALALALWAGTGFCEDTGQGEEDDRVVLGEEDLAERGEIARNAFRRITPGDEPLVQDVGTWPVAWEEFPSRWAGAATGREYGAWVVPVAVAQENGATVICDAPGAVLWRGETDFAKPESASVTLLGGLVAEEDWDGYEAVKDFANVWQNDAGFAKHWQNASPPRGMATNGLRFTSVEVSTNGTVELALAWEEDGEADIFAYAIPHDPGERIFTWTNDENQVETVTNAVWTMAGENLSGFDNDWEWRGTATVSNGEGLFVDAGFPAYLGQIRFYAAAEATDTDGDGFNDGMERFVFHTDPNVPNGGDPNPSGTNATPNVFWLVTTTNEYARRYGQPDCSFNAPAQLVATIPVMGVPPTPDSVVQDVTVTGFVDDGIKVDGTGVEWRRDIHVFDHRSITNEIADLQSGQFELQLWDWPRADYQGPNEARLGDTNGHPFQVEWTWAVPMDFRLEHITTNGAPLVVNPSGTEPNREITCLATVLPTNIPDTDIHWEVSGAGMTFSGGTNFGREVHLAASRTGDWVARVTVSNSTLPPARLRGTVLEKKTVPVFLHIVRDDDGQNPAMTVAHFQELLVGANQIFEQAAIEFQLTTNVVYIDHGAWLTIPTNDNFVAYGTLQSTSSHTGGVEVYCVNSFTGNKYRGRHRRVGNAQDGLTITSNATSRTLAHELGHACGLNDIYTNRTANAAVSMVPSGRLACKAWAPCDWCEEAPSGGYGGVSQVELIMRLLMYGKDASGAWEAKVDIPAGRIWGVDASARRRLAKVGLSDMGTREPQHW